VRQRAEVARLLFLVEVETKRALILALQKMAEMVRPAQLLVRKTQNVSPGVLVQRVNTWLA
jgi:hypothetical protein